jgi:iron complex transport system substrate-binding protein
VREGAPSQKTCRLAAQTNPSRKGEIVHRRLFAALVAALAAAALTSVGSARTTAVPHRIVSLSPTATESLYAIGAERQVIAVDDQSDYPKRAPRTKLSGFTPNVEAIASYKPDLVVLAYDTGGVVASLRKLKVRVLVQPAATGLPDAYAQILELGGVTGHAKKAKAVVAGMKGKIARIVAAAPRERTVAVYHELTPDLYSATSKTFIGRIYTLFGLHNIADAADSTASGYPKLSNEYIVGSNPGLIVLADTRCCAQSPATVSARPGWSGIAAVRNRAIVRVDDSIASRWGPRVVDFTRAVGSALRTSAR